MSKVLVVFGATGQQGGSVANYVINDPVLSKEFKVRGVTRDASKPAAQDLKQKGIEVVEADMDNIESLKKAVQGAHTVFAITSSIHDENLKKREIAQGKAMADAAVSQGAQHIIFSTLPHAGRMSNNKYTKVDHFDGKAEVEDYIRTLPIKSAFFIPGFFMQNFKSIIAPQPNGDGTYTLSNVVSPKTELPLIDIVHDAGKFIGAILADPEKYEGKVLTSATKVYTFEEIVNIMSKATGKTVNYKQIPEREYRVFLPPSAAEELIQMFLFYQDFGFNGPKTRELVGQTAEIAHGKLTTFEEFVVNEPFELK
ncbi:hypothetical protein BGX21_010442 [Mortierella sp. AD011]|nr:hypothetical protein BGX20_010355 [Mortierella sp. AD010]KAF9394226.1 hypothetical protein BGX21_010442 [Mortierella sp. AD011]